MKINTTVIINIFSISLISVATDSAGQDVGLDVTRLSEIENFATIESEIISSKQIHYSEEISKFSEEGFLSEIQLKDEVRWRHIVGSPEMPIATPDFQGIPKTNWPDPFPVPVPVPQRHCEEFTIECIEKKPAVEDLISNSIIFYENKLTPKTAPSCKDPQDPSLNADCWRARHDTVQITTNFYLSDSSFGFETIPINPDGSLDYRFIDPGTLAACTGFVRPGSRKIIDTVFHCAVTIANGEIFGLENMAENSIISCSNSQIRVALRSLDPMPSTTLVGRCKTIKRLPGDRAEIMLDEPLGQLAPEGVLGEIELPCKSNVYSQAEPLFSVQYAYGKYRVEVHTGEMRPPEGCRIALNWIRNIYDFDDNSVMCTSVDTVVGSSGAPVFGVGQHGLTLLGFASSAASSEFKDEREALLRNRQIPEDCGDEGGCNLFTRFKPLDFSQESLNCSIN